jgi:uncharacterized phiE125 gp8 family phage protein
MFAPRLETPPAAMPVSLADAKQHLRVLHSEDDLLITGLIAAATSHLDGWTGILGRALVTQTWSQGFAAFAPRLDLPVGPVASVVSLRYVNAAGALETAPAALYDLLEDARGAYILLKSGEAWPEANPRAAQPVVATYVAGQPAADVPPAIRAALLLMVGDLYANRESTASAAAAIPMSTTVAALLAPWRRVGF